MGTAPQICRTSTPNLGGAKGTRTVMTRDKVLSRDSAPETGGQPWGRVPSVPKGLGTKLQAQQLGTALGTWGHGPEQDQHPKPRGHGPGDTAEHSGDSGTAADHGQQPVPLPWSGTCPGVLGTLLGLSPRTRGHPNTGTGPGPGDTAPETWGQPQSTWGQVPNWGQCYSSAGTEPTEVAPGKRGWHPEVAVTSQQGVTVTSQHGGGSDIPARG